MMGEIKNSNNTNSNRSAGKKNISAERPRLSGNKNESSKVRADGNGNNNNNTKNSKNKNGKKNPNNSTSMKSLGTKAAKQEVMQDTAKSLLNGVNSNINSRTMKSKMVDNCTQTSSPLRLHLDGMFKNTAGGYQRAMLKPVAEEGIEEGDDELRSEADVLGSPLSSCRSSARTSFSTKEYDYDCGFKTGWTGYSKEEQVLFHPQQVPRCFEDLEKTQEYRLSNLAEQLNSLVPTVWEIQQ